MEDITASMLGKKDNASTNEITIYVQTPNIYDYRLTELQTDLAYPLNAADYESTVDVEINRNSETIHKVSEVRG